MRPWLESQRDAERVLDAALTLESLQHLVPKPTVFSVRSLLPGCCGRQHYVVRARCLRDMKEGQVCTGRVPDLFGFQKMASFW